MLPYKSEQIEKGAGVRVLTRGWLTRTPAVVAAVMLAGAGTAAAKPNGVACGATLTSDTTLLADVVGCSGDGLSLDPGVTLNLNGHVISGSGTGIGVRGGNVANGTVSGFETGIGFASTITNMTVSGNGTGINFSTSGTSGCHSGLRRRVEDSTIADNANTGIFLNAGACNVDVANNRVMFNGGDGVWASLSADGGTYTNNFIHGNGANGINIRESFSAVVGNTVSDNGADGIHMSDDVVSGSNYFVAGNLSYRNGGLGIWTWIFCSPGFCNPPVMTDGGGNAANRNGDPQECVNVTCARNRGLATAGQLGPGRRPEVLPELTLP